MRTRCLVGFVSALLLLSSCEEVPPPPIEVALRIDAGSAQLPFSVSASGRYDVELQYAKAADEDLNKDLNALSGIAAITSGDKTIKRVEMPTH